jgi:hypothetical protein
MRPPILATGISNSSPKAQWELVGNGILNDGGNAVKTSSYFLKHRIDSVLARTDKYVIIWLRADPFGRASILTYIPSTYIGAAGTTIIPQSDVA